MKKNIFLLLAASCSLVACDPVQEDFSNGGHISVEQLKALSSVTVDKSQSGQNGNVITCSTEAPVNARWDIGYVDPKNSGKEFHGNYAKQKMLTGNHVVRLTAVCADGTVLVDTFQRNCEVITDSLKQVYIYGANPAEQPAFKPGAWDAAAMRFSDNEGRCWYKDDVVENDEDGKFGVSPMYTNLPYLTDEVYWGCKTLIFVLSDVSDNCDMKVMNGWWSATYYDHVMIKQQMKGDKWELPLTAAIAADCARGNGGGGRDLDLMLYNGSMTVHAIYYEE